MASALRSKVVNIALSHVNTVGGKAPGDDKFISYYNQIAGTKFSVDSTPWCAIFVTYCLRMAGVPTSICPNFAGPVTVQNKFLAPKGQYMLRGTYTPKTGDLIFFNWDKRSEPLHHVGIIEKVDGAKVYTIEGNSKGGYSDYGVRHKSYPLTSGFITGYGALDYEQTGVSPNPTQPAQPVQQTPAAPVEPEQKTPANVIRPKQYATYVKSFQSWLNKNYGATLAVDGSCGPKTKKAAVKALQSHLNTTYSAGLKVDGRFGPATIAAVRDHAQLHPGAKGNLVYLAQGLLYGSGVSAGGFDGSYGPMMRSAIATYQTRKRIARDGVIGVNTWSCLVR